MKITQDSKISVPIFRKLLGAAALNLSDSEVERMRDLADRIADFVFDDWLRKRNSPPQVAGLQAP